MYRPVHVLVEDRDDREFFNAVIRPVLQAQYDYVEIWEYAGRTIARRMEYIRSIEAMKGDYFFVADINSSPCVTDRKSKLAESHKGRIDPKRTIVVAKEIESWYLAGLDDEAGRRIGVPSLPRTDAVTKEDFCEMIPKPFSELTTDFMAEILKGFSVEMARAKNRSFCYLMDRLEGKSKKV
jgi:hypothetical protein